MKVRCGACRGEFDVHGPGQYPCPACGAVNQVRAAYAPPGAGPGPATAAPGGLGGAPGGMPPPAMSEGPSPRLTCPECGLSFIVGDIDVATCPNCGREVSLNDHEEASS